MSSKLLPVGVTTLLVFLVSGCGVPSGSESSPPPPPASLTQKTGAQLWAENCNRCHNFRPPNSFSETQWHAIEHHMRIRCNLTGYEQREITKFLQSDF